MYGNNLAFLCPKQFKEPNLKVFVSCRNSVTNIKILSFWYILWSILSTLYNHNLCLYGCPDEKNGFIKGQKNSTTGHRLKFACEVH